MSNANILAVIKLVLLIILKRLYVPKNRHGGYLMMIKGLFVLFHHKTYDASPQ